MTREKDAKEIIERQRKHFLSGATREVGKRIESLRKFELLIGENEDRIYEAIKRDLGRSASESYMGEILTCKGELSFAIKNLPKWARGARAATPPVHLPATSRVEPEPYGTVLVMSPWNYPVQLALIPAISAIAAGNTVVIKPSEHSPHSSAALSELIGKYFDPELVCVVEGSLETSKRLLEERFDRIFYTGGPKGGRAVLRAAAEHLTPVTLELGGKSPCIVRDVRNLKSAAKRIAWGKFFNAGQTCVAPDYLLVQESLKDALVEEMAGRIRAMYGDNPKESRDFARIINEAHFDRIAGLLKGEKIAVGGETDRGELYIAPTILDISTWESPAMQEEIFGPVLPVIAFDSPEEIIPEIRKRGRPLALYVFTDDRRFKEKILSSISSGGACVNDVLVHICVTSLPFGGVGESGFGSYHGKAGFDAFSHYRSIMERGLGLDTDLKFPPYGDFSESTKKFFELMNK